MRIAAALHHHQFEHRQIGAMRFDKSDVRLAGRGLDDDRLEFRLVLGGVELLLQIVLADAQSVRNLRKVLFESFGIVAQQQNAEGRIAIDQHAAFAVEHSSARRDDRNVADLIAFGEIGEMAGLNDLQLPESHQQEER